MADLSQNLLISHVVLMTSAFLFFFPLGAILARLHLPFLTILTLHAPSQILALTLAISGVGIGIKLASVTGYEIGKNAHTLIGLVVVFALLAFQPIGGFLQHRYTNKTGRRGVQGTGHVWFGRSMIILGIINGGLGLQMAGDTHLDRTIAYIAIAAIVGALYGLALIWDVWRVKGVKNIIALPDRKDGGFDKREEDSNGFANT